MPSVVKFLPPSHRRRLSEARRAGRRSAGAVRPRSSASANSRPDGPAQLGETPTIVTLRTADGTTKNAKSTKIGEAGSRPVGPSFATVGLRSPGRCPGLSSLAPIGACVVRRRGPGRRVALGYRVWPLSGPRQLRPTAPTGRSWWAAFRPKGPAVRPARAVGPGTVTPGLSAGPTGRQFPIRGPMPQSLASIQRES